jgi:hypothetical protein
VATPMKMQQMFNLKLSANLPEIGFSLDELIIESKKMFETEGYCWIFAGFVNFVGSGLSISIQNSP